MSIVSTLLSCTHNERIRIDISNEAQCTVTADVAAIECISAGKRESVDVGMLIVHLTNLDSVPPALHDRLGSVDTEDWLFEIAARQLEPDTWTTSILQVWDPEGESYLNLGDITDVHRLRM